MISCKKVSGKTEKDLANSIKQGAQEFVMESLKKSGALNTLESCEVSVDNMKGSIGNDVYSQEEFEHYEKKRRTGRSAFIYFKR